MTFLPVLAGVDEAGRGPFAGPVVAAAVILTAEQSRILKEQGLRDSKKMTALRREKVFATMVNMKVLWAAQAASVEMIDRINILNATLWAMKKAVDRLPGSMFDGVIVDGDKEIPGLTVPQQVVPKGDDLYPQISAASVVAKVLRDRVMTVLDGLYPEYGFSSHKGYGTKAHREAMNSLGLSPVHRKSFHWRG